jgi:superfamily I DNA/RNA helicase
MSEENRPEVYKVIGAPGTGKTTRVVGNPELELQGLFLENSDEYPLEDQMFVTYTNSGVDEAADRLYNMTDWAKTNIQDRVTTIHSRCYSILNDHPHFNGLKREQVVQHWDKKKWCDIHDLEFGWDDDEDDIMGADQAEGNMLFDIYGWLQSNRKPLEEWEDCPNAGGWQHQRSPEWLMNHWEEHKEENNLVGFGDMIIEVLNYGKQQLENLNWTPIFEDDYTTRELFESVKEHPKYDPDVIRDKGAFVDTKVLYVDEVQDLTPLQWEWYLLQKLVAEKVYIGGDDDQCLPPNAPVEVKGSPMDVENRGKEFQKPIKDVNVGDLVRTLTSDGEYSYRRVSHVEKKEVNEKTFRTIRTESGNLTAVTDNHKMIARVPDAEYQSQVDKHYVYLMRDNEGRWRIGKTDNLRQRLNVERGARCIIPVASFDTKEKALEKEAEWSLNYSIPQLTIEQRGGEVLSDPDVRERLYDSVNPQYGLIERDLGVFLESPPLYKKSTTRGQTQSVNINIKKCADMRGDKPRHSFNVQTSDEGVKETLRGFSELTEGESGSGSTRFRTTSTNYSKLGDLAEEVSAATGGDIITVMSPTEERSTATITPAGNLVEGMLIPVTQDGEVVWEEIVEINDKTETTEVYDLTVPGTHNFTTSGIGVSNTIYGWSGANPEFMLNEEGDFEVLDRTYRIPKNIWEVCDQTIRQVDERQEKEVTPDGDGGTVKVMQEPSVGSVISELEETDDCFVLFRARYMIDEFRDTLHEKGIPYQNMSTYDTWGDSDIVNIATGLGKIKKGEIKLTHEEVSSMTDKMANEYLVDENLRQTGDSMMDKWNGISADEVGDMFKLPGVQKDGTISPKQYLHYCKEEGDINYYEKEAIEGVVKKDTFHLDPEAVKLGTIHSSKGQEAEKVILALDSTQTITSEMHKQIRDKPDKRISDAERRVYYVGMSRASDTLVLCQGMIDPETTLRIGDLVGDLSDLEVEKVGKQPVTGRQGESNPGDAWL